MRKERFLRIALIAVISLGVGCESKFEKTESSGSCDFWAPCRNGEICVYDDTLKITSDNNDENYSQGLWRCLPTNLEDVDLIPCPNDEGRFCAKRKQ